jgi:hypothetical protein
MSPATKPKARIAGKTPKITVIKTPLATKSGLLEEDNIRMIHIQKIKTVQNNLILLRV